MSIRKIMVAALAALGAGWALADAPSITEVNMTQQADKTVVITYKLANGPAVITFDIEADGVSIGGRNLWSVSADSEVFKKVSGAATDVHTIRWSPTVDWQDRVLPANGVRAVVKAWALDDKTDYMVVPLTDLQVDGESYYPSVDFLPGGLLENAAYRTSKLVMRKIMAKDVTWKMGSSNEPGRNSTWEGYYDVTLTNNYYIGVFEVTKAQYVLFFTDQWSNPNFDKGGYFTGADDNGRLMRPLEKMYCNEFRGCDLWHDTPSSTSFLGILRERTGIDFDIPSEAQWEYACRAGYAQGAWGNGEVYNNDLSNIPGRYAGNSDYQNLSQYVVGNYNAAPADKGTAIVGSYAPNAWGLYDMHGNVAEYCQDFLSVVFDPHGAVCETVPSTNYRVIKGGHYKSAATDCRSASRGWGNYTWSSDQYGYRLYCQAGLK